MRSVPFKSVLYAVATAQGLDPEEEMQINQALAWASYLSSRVASAWELHDWPFSRGCDERTVTNGVVSLDDPGENPISEILDVWTADPRRNPAARQVPFELWSEGAVLAADAPETVWVTYSSPAPQFSAREWKATTAYDVGDVIYHLGECWLCLTANTNTPPTDSSAWAKQAFPAALKLYAVRGALADILDEDGSQDKSRLMEAKAEAALTDELQKLMIKQKQAAGYSA